MPGLFAVGIEVIGNPTVARSRRSLVLDAAVASFTGPMADRVRAQIGLAVCGACS